MSILSAVKNLVEKVNDHTESLKLTDNDINELFDRVIALEGGEKESLPTGESEESSSDEEGLKLEE